MITFIIKILSAIASIPLFFTGHWIWGIICLILTQGFYIKVDGKTI